MIKLNLQGFRIVNFQKKVDQTLVNTVKTRLPVTNIFDPPFVH